MSILTLLLLGLLHGLQPDHAAAAASLAARTGTPAWQAALRIAAGHALALVAIVFGVSLLPAGLAVSLGPWADGVAGLSLVGVGLALLLQALRSKYVVHAHHHQHDGEAHGHLHAHAMSQVDAHTHRHATGALALGVVLGLGSARTLVILLPAMAGAGSGISAIVLYCGGIAMGAGLVSGGLDLIRGAVGRQNGARWIDLASGVGAVAAGTHLVVSAFA